MPIQFTRVWEANVRFFGQEALQQISPQTQLLKLHAEAYELEAEPSIEEAADVLVCLVGYCIKQGWSAHQLLAAWAKKTAINLQRKWVRQSDGTFQHVKESK